MDLRCSQSLCKASVPEPPASEADPWPLVCPGCQTALYPKDVLERLPVQELHPNRSLLLVKTDQGLVDANESDVRGPQGAPRVSLSDMLAASEPRVPSEPREPTESAGGLLDMMLDDAEASPPPRSDPAPVPDPDIDPAPASVTAPESASRRPSFAALVLVVVLVLVALAVYLAGLPAGS